MKKHFLIPLFVAILLVNAGCKKDYDETSPKMAPVTEAVFASGSIDPKDAYTVTSLSDGFIEKTYVTENDKVHDGQLLFRLDNRQQNTQVAIAKTNLQYAQISAGNNSPNLSQAAAQVDAARVKMRTDSMTLARYRNLLTTNSVSRQDVDNANMNYQSSLSGYKEMMANYRSTAYKTKQDLDVSQSQLQNAEAGNQYYNLVAIGESKVYQIFKKQGDLVRRGEQVAQLGNPDSIVVNLDVDENSISKVQLGQAVLVELNTEKNKAYEATVSKVYPHFNETSQSYKVEARFAKDITGIIAGTQLQANIVVAKKEQALLIPRTYLMDNNKVLVRKDKKVDTVNVTTGIVSDNWVEILTGLTTNDTVLKPR